MGKNICWLLAAASRASINMQFAKQNNIGDLAGKSVSQFTASTLIGVGIGLAISKLCNIGSLYTLIPVFSVMTVGNILCSYLSINVLDEVYFNY